MEPLPSDNPESDVRLVLGGIVRYDPYTEVASALVCGWKENRSRNKGSPKGQTPRAVVDSEPCMQACKVQQVTRRRTVCEQYTAGYSEY